MGPWDHQLECDWLLHALLYHLLDLAGLHGGALPLWAEAFTSSTLYSWRPLNTLDQSLDCVFSYRPGSLVAGFPSALATADWSWARVHRGTPNPQNFLGVWLVVILPWDGIQCIPAFSDPVTGSTLHCTNGNPGSEAAFLLSKCFRTPPWQFWLAVATLNYGLLVMILRVPGHILKHCSDLEVSGNMQRLS